ncbi:ATPase [Tamlana sp. 2_MG-2023]|uniref:ATPase n=1 Tax=unclassified Tamlana TaxID=2614803 RepID=UPI0026E11835|nr:MULTISPECIES: ATPase [unclassified Tamlana]MDO6761627.1 ATPase [Tamlana sp. 2_MG-2023]MDO6792453.1 ATPase [Tamlana sp. 1_MG-2023]
MVNPCKIVEGNIEYAIGSFDGKAIMYDFEKILDYLDAKGKILFGTSFRIYKEDHPIILKLCHYFIKDKENCDKNDIDPDKGILLSGPVGCGKTSLMLLLKFIVPLQKPYTLIPSRNIVFGFNHIGYKTIEDFGSKQFFCFDDLGVEPIGRHYGKDCNVMGEILLSRYELFINHRIKTHATTNLNAQELEDLYGNRVRSRMRKLFNLIAFDADTGDKRK